MSLLEAAQDRICLSGISTTNIAGIREIEMPTALILQQCLLITERYIDDTFRLLAKVTVLESTPNGIAKVAYLSIVGDLVQTLVFTVDFRRQMIDGASISIHDSQHDITSFI